MCYLRFSTSGRRSGFPGGAATNRFSRLILKEEKKGLNCIQYFDIEIEFMKFEIYLLVSFLALNYSSFMYHETTV